MRDEPPRAEGLGAIEPVVVRSFSREYRLHTTDPGFRRQLAFLGAEPDMPGIALDPVDIEIPFSNGTGRLRLPTGITVEASGDHLINKLHQLFVSELNAELHGAAIIHGATLVGKHGRTVLIGAKGSGKTTLSMHMLSAGHTLEGDEHIAVFDEDALVRPRNLRIKEGSIPLVPALAEAVRSSPWLFNPEGGRVYSVSPRIAGRAWTILNGPIAHLVFIEANHGGRSTLQPMPLEQAFSRLMESVMIADAGKLMAVVRLRRLVAKSARWRLSLGDLGGAGQHLVRLL